MDALVHEGWLFFKLIIDNWAALLIISGIFGWMYRKMTKKQEEQLRILLVVIKRVELGEAINHDYGLQIVSGIFDEYTALGGNHYAHEIYERYKVGKEHENIF
ncbi:hypothetical protein GRR92_06335 [Lactococcus lactis subsp. lactis]|uniref:hypothetical protein n=1 Tax=Lactococcus TaxID=1357 RepID=UPI001BA4F958|nr:hypothetical protein [Lactococcus lactis]MBR8674088.1 hypothetical protein [Lactococcus lactis subsp. lactis]MBR8676953.1 hypothetical protein [Lactococcus lactis subsp. lactis]MBR8684260.1 hypothetical protein [Lactococcus lactis subsp. lactis]MCH5427604.1 hypothetical protein [Lactococcus lactis]MCT0084367.1 hypothetical protein [Lactococcus lactis subsp. lactis]